MEHEAFRPWLVEQIEAYAQRSLNDRTKRSREYHWHTRVLLQGILAEYDRRAAPPAIPTEDDDNGPEPDINNERPRASADYWRKSTPAIPTEASAINYAGAFNRWMAAEIEGRIAQTGQYSHEQLRTLMYLGFQAGAIYMQSVAAIPTEASRTRTETTHDDPSRIGQFGEGPAPQHASTNRKARNDV